MEPRITFTVEGLLTFEAIRDNGSWTVIGKDEDHTINLTATDEQMGAIMFLATAGNPSNTALDQSLYDLLTEEQKHSGLVP